MPKLKFEIVPDQKSKLHLIRKAKSRIHGHGIFAERTIPKNTFVLQYTGQKIHRKEADRREDIHADRGELWLFEINRNWYIDADIEGGIAKYVNHSDKPNLWIDIVKGEIWYRAAKTILPNEELTVDYGTELPGTPSKN